MNYIYIILTAAQAAMPMVTQNLGIYLYEMLVERRDIASCIYIVYE